MQVRENPATEEERKAANAETNLRMMIFFNYCKLFVIALIFIANRVWSGHAFDEFGGLVGFFGRLYVLIPIYVADVVLTLLWRKSHVAVIAHLVVCVLLGLPFYATCLAFYVKLLFFIIIPAIFLIWCMTLSTIAMVWNHDWRKKKPASKMLGDNPNG